MREDIFSIEGKVVAITGGTGILGGSVFNHLSRSGVKVALIGRTLAKIEEKLEANAHIQPDNIGLVADVMDENALQKAREKILNKFGRLDGLINAAGGNVPESVVQPDQSVFDVPINSMKKALDLNLIGTVQPTLILGKVMGVQGSGSIINISSMAASQAITRVLGYSLAKAGIDMFTKWLATELAHKYGDKLRVNAIAPGFFISHQNQRLLTNEDGTYTERGGYVIQNTPMKRFGEAAELNGMVQYLLSDASSFVTGTIFPIDGGFSSFSGV